jgi:hypothetical protein
MAGPIYAPIILIGQWATSILADPFADGAALETLDRPGQSDLQPFFLSGLDGDLERPCDDGDSRTSDDVSYVDRMNTAELLTT